LEKLRMQRPLKKAECQFFNCYIDLRQFHSKNPAHYTKCVLLILTLLYKKYHIYSSVISVLIMLILTLIGL
jgi:hypothetical protein